MRSKTRTEGWIAGLQLAALSLRGRTDVSGFIGAFTGSHRFVLDYLVDEVLQHQPQHVRDFLLHTAVLDRLTGPLCDAVTGRADGSAMLESLERANLFVVALDEYRSWFRYHHLFADVLRARLLSEEPDLVPVLHRRASDWYEHHDLVEDAVRHALAGRDFERAAHLMELALPALRRNRQDATLARLAQRAPRRRGPAQRRAQRLLRMDADGLRRPRRPSKNGWTTPRGRSPPAGHRTPDNEELRTLPMTLAIYRASLAQARGDATVPRATPSVRSTWPDRTTISLAAPPPASSGLAAWANGDVEPALQTFPRRCEACGWPETLPTR